ncbi:MAG: tRNA (adenosine(37)-N6)-threonylcarbamoyltransferase complex dimerization subunit type 1 TsaB [Clostridia bacterium]|nr:tRNA (adenosine(37)-N6)-threonylcarbamoyltransferase complex dimerization subunit type 1 TsaB [Clostridia bacterium]
MIIYACDSTAGTASVALCDDEKLLAEFTLNGGNTHTETLLPMTETMFATLKMSIDDVDLFACSVGPGSFTGVRIGVSTVKGLAFGKGKPCAAVSTLEALAMNPKKELIEATDSIICPCMDARRGQLYNALFDYEGGILKRLTYDRTVSASALKEELINSGRTVYFCGDGAHIMEKQFSEGFAKNLMIPTDEKSRYQSAFSVASAARLAALKGETVTEAELRPVYLRLPQAERERLERLSLQASK